MTLILDLCSVGHETDDGNFSVVCRPEKKGEAAKN